MPNRMATLRKASAYSKRHVTPFTRISKKKKKAFIKTNPPHKIVKFEMGNPRGFTDGKYTHILNVIVNEKIQIRHNAIESARQYLTKKLDETTNSNYFFKIIPYPHHIQREHKMLTGAGADRMSGGMQLSFGKTVGKAVIAKKGDILFKFALATEKDTQATRQFIKAVKAKLPGTIRVNYEFIGKK